MDETGNKGSPAEVHGLGVGRKVIELKRPKLIRPNEGGEMTLQSWKYEDTGDNQTQRTAPEPTPTRDRYKGTVVVHHEPSPKAGGFSMPAATFGVVLEHPSGEVEEMWGTTYAPEPIAPTVLAITMVLEEVPSTAVAEIWTLSQFRRYVEAPDDIIRGAIYRSGRSRQSGKKLNPWNEMQQVLRAKDAGRWELRTYDDHTAAPHYDSARHLAKGVAWRAALSHKAESLPTSIDHPQASIVLRSK